MSASGKIIVVGDDFSPMGEDAILEGLSQLAAGGVQRLHVVHVHDAGEDVSAAERRRLETALGAGTTEAMARRVRYLATMSGLPYDADRVTTHARLGKTREVLLASAEELDADLMIVGTQGRTGIARWLMGSVAEALVRKARCPVLVARPKGQREADTAPLPAAYYASREQPSIALTKEERAHLASTISED